MPPIFPLNSNNEADGRVEGSDDADQDAASAFASGNASNNRPGEWRARAMPNNSRSGATEQCVTLTLLFKIACYAVGTICLWSKLEYAFPEFAGANPTFAPILMEPAWAIVIIPMWVGHAVGIACYALVLRIVMKKHRHIYFYAWPYRARNLALFAVDELVGDVAMCTSLALLRGPLNGGGESIMVILCPLWAAFLVTLKTYHARRPRGKGRFLLKPLYVIAMLIALRVDGFMDGSWVVQLIPVWIACCMLGLILVAAFFMSFVHLCKSRAPVRRISLFFASSVMSSVTLICGFLFWKNLAIRLDGGDEAVTVGSIMEPLLIAELSALLGLCIFAICMTSMRQRAVDCAIVSASERRGLDFKPARDLKLLQISSLFYEVCPSFRGESAEGAEGATCDGQEEENEQAVAEQNCIICFENHHSVVFLPCGHAGACVECTQRIVDDRPALCPICRKLVKNIAKLDRDDGGTLGGKRVCVANQIAAVANNNSERVGTFDPVRYQMRSHPLSPLMWCIE